MFPVKKINTMLNAHLQRARKYHKTLYVLLIMAKRSRNKYQNVFR